MVPTTVCPFRTSTPTSSSYSCDYGGPELYDILRRMYDPQSHPLKEMIKERERIPPWRYFNVKTYEGVGTSMRMGPFLFTESLITFNNSTPTGINQTGETTRDGERLLYVEGDLNI